MRDPLPSDHVPNLRPGWEDVYAKSLDCVHCGLCLQDCPTYVETGREISSPRGRVYLMRGAAEGRFSPAGVLADEAELCLGCRACETACPSGVRYGAMLEQTRRELSRAGLRGGPARRFERFALRELLPHRRRLAFLIDVIALVEFLRVDRLLLPLLPSALRDARALAPRIPARAERAPLPGIVPAEGERRGRVGFLIGCVMPQLLGAVNAATVRVLSRNGFDVIIPHQQGCCGALHAHAGDMDYAERLARNNLQVFTSAGVDAVVTNSAGCGAAMREAGSWLPEIGEPLAALTRDISEFLDAVGLRAPPGRVDARVCYDDPCHLLHAQRVGAAPRNLLERIPGLTLIAHEHPEACCGAAGTYNLSEPRMARAVLARKLEALRAAGPDIIATGNPGCILQLRAGALRAGLRARVAHPVELLDEAYRIR